MTRQRVFDGWWVTIAFAVLVVLSTGVRFSVGPFLKPIGADLGTGTIFIVHQGGAALGSRLGGLLFEVIGSYGGAFGIASVQLLVTAIVSLNIDEAAGGVARLRAAAAER